MSIPSKSDWPVTTDGTTDWHVLFENEETGLLAIISATTAPAQLKQQTEAIIQTVFTRKRDMSVLAKVTAFLEKLIPEDVSDEHFPVMKASVLQLLGKIKENRIERAASYVEKKAKKGKRKKSKKKNNRRPNRIVGFFRRRADALVFLFDFKNMKKNEEKGSASEHGEDTFFKQDAYVDHGGDGNDEWQDSDMHAMKEGKAAKLGAFDDMEKKKPDNKYESWDDY
jgi:hypothetical protein